MQNREKLVRVVAEKLELTPDQVRDVVRSQHMLVRQTMQTDKNKTIYLRKIGTFAHADLRYRLRKEKIKRSTQQINNIEDESPLEFD